MDPTKFDALLTYLDGSDGSMWQGRATLGEVRNDPELCKRLYVRVSDLLSLYEPETENH